MKISETEPTNKRNLLRIFILAINIVTDPIDKEALLNRGAQTSHAITGTPLKYVC